MKRTTDTAYFHDYIYHQAELRFIRGRLHFAGRTLPLDGSHIP